MRDSDREPSLQTCRRKDPRCGGRFAPSIGLIPVGARLAKTSQRSRFDLSNLVSASAFVFNERGSEAKRRSAPPREGVPGPHHARYQLARHRRVLSLRQAKIRSNDEPYSSASSFGYVRVTRISPARAAGRGRCVPCRAGGSRGIDRDDRSVVAHRAV